MGIEHGHNSRSAGIETAIVGFIDILGYASLVARHQVNDDIINRLEKLLRATVVDLPKRLHEETRPNDPELYIYRSKIAEAINIKLISDTVLFTLYLDRLDNRKPEGSEFNPITDAIWAYFMMIEMFSLHFIAKTGHVLRGGISIGKHYESALDHPGHLFIFSSSYLNACKAERKAKSARIIIDEVLVSYLFDLKRPDYIREHFYEDPDQIQCVDIYSFLKTDSEAGDNPKQVLTDIKRGVSANIIFNKSNLRALEKLNYFAHYHNNWLLENGWKDTDLYISPAGCKTR
jgi:hypothetical protein